MKFLLKLASVFFLTGCAVDPQNGGESSEIAVIAPTLEPVSGLKELKAIPLSIKSGSYSPDRFYGRFRTTSALSNQFLAQNSGGLPEILKRLFAKESAGFTVSIELTSRNIYRSPSGLREFQIVSSGKIPVMAFGENTRDTNLVPFKKIRQVETEAFRLYPGAELSVDVHVIYHDKTEWAVVQETLGYVDQLAAPLGLLRNLARDERDRGVLENYDDFINGIIGRSDGREYSQNFAINPSNGYYGLQLVYSAEVRGSDVPLGATTIFMGFQESVLGAEVLPNDTGVISVEENPLSFTQFSALKVPLASPLFAISELSVHTDIREFVQRTVENQSPSDFSVLCQSYRDFMLRNGFTFSDANLALLQSLDRFGWRSRPLLVNSRCFSDDDRSALKGIGVEIPEPVVILDSGDESPITVQNKNMLLGPLRTITPSAEFSRLWAGLAAFGNEDRIELHVESKEAQRVLQTSGDRVSWSELGAVLRMLRIERIGVHRVPKRRTPQGTMIEDYSFDSFVAALEPESPNSEPIYLITEWSTTPFSGPLIGRLRLLDVDESQVLELHQHICDNKDEPRPSWVKCFDAV